MKIIKKYKAFLEAKTNELFVSPNMKSILDLLNESFSNGWYGTQLNEKFSCSLLDNGWLDMVYKHITIDGIKPILDKIEQNRIDMWVDDLKTTFECILSEDIEENGEILVKYNGWYEELKDLLLENLISENQSNTSSSYIVTVKENDMVDDIAEQLEIKGCQIKNVYPYGVIVCNYNGNIDDLKTDDILEIKADKITQMI
jgi:uncharacterized UPF0160 family protein